MSPEFPRVAGIPEFLRPALGDFVEHCKAFAKESTAVGKPFAEACGLFLFFADDWIPGHGWAGRVRYVPVRNLAKRDGGFVMDNNEVQQFMGQALDARMEVAELICIQRGWDSSTPWTIPFFEHANAEFDLQHVDMTVTPEVRTATIKSYFEQEALDLMQGWDKKKQLALRVSLDGAEESDRSVPRLSAAEWLMARGITVLAGIGHSHPSGDADMSPEDFHHTAVVDAWKKIFQCRFPAKGQKRDSFLEANRSVGNWIYALPDRVEFFNPSLARSENPGTIRDAPRTKLGSVNTFQFSGHSTIVRYDARGKRGEWRGPF